MVLVLALIAQCVYGVILIGSLAFTEVPSLSGPLIQKTYTDTFADTLQRWTSLGYVDTNEPSFDVAEQAMRFDVYGSGGWWNTLPIQFHKDYTASLECDVKVASTNTKYWIGIVLYSSQQNYSTAVLVKNMNVVGGTTNLLMAQNEWGTGSITNYGAVAEDAYQRLKVTYDPSTDTISTYLNGVLKGTQSNTLMQNISISIISTADNSSYHTLGWFKNLSATGVFVVGMPSMNLREYMQARNNVDTSPPFDDVSGEYQKSGVELEYSTGYHWFKPTASVETFPAEYYGPAPENARQDDGTFATSGDYLTVPYEPPNLSAWDKLQWQVDFAAGTVKVQVCDAAGSLISDVVIPGNSSRINLNGISSIDLSGLDVGTYPQLSFRVYLTTTTTASSPKVYDLYTTFSTTSDALEYDASLEITPIASNSTIENFELILTHGEFSVEAVHATTTIDAPTIVSHGGELLVADGTCNSEISTPTITLAVSGLGIRSPSGVAYTVKTIDGQQLALKRFFNGAWI
jgi:hypothetical protein